jgi:hypothetical protein
VSPRNVTNVQNTSGYESGGTLVDIHGSGFEFPPAQVVTDVTFGGVRSNFKIDGDQHITAPAPPAPSGTGTVAIEVTNIDGTTAAGWVQYLPDPAEIVYVDPPSGSMQGGSDVTITGSHFGTTSDVFFGNTPAAWQLNSDTEILAVSPPGQEAVDVTVVNAAGPSRPATFTYVPIVTDIAPRSSSGAGGATMGILGRGLNSTLRADVDGVAGSNLVVVSDTEVEIEIPPGQARYS